MRVCVCRCLCVRVRVRVRVRVLCACDSAHMYTCVSVVDDTVMTCHVARVWWCNELWGGYD